MSSQHKAFFCDVVFDGCYWDIGENLISPSLNSSSLPPPPTKSPNIQSFQQQLNELISTEKSYVKRITALKLNYADPLRQFAKHKDTQIINHFDAKSLFANIDQILHINYSFLTELEHANEFNIGNICMSHFPYLTPYNQYYFNRQKSVELFKDLLKKKSFVEFIDRTQWQTTGINNIGLRELLMEPVQRIPRYILLLQGMMNYLDQSHDQRSLLFQALDLASKIASCEADETTKRATLMHTLQRNIQDFPPNLISHNRTLIDSIDVDDLPTPLTSHIDDPLPCTLFLFNDKLVIAKRPSAHARGRKLSGLDDLDASNPSSTPAKSWGIGIAKHQLVCKVVADLSDVTLTDLSHQGDWFFSCVSNPLTHNSELGIVFNNSAFADCDDERFNRSSKAFSATQVSFSPSEPLSTDSPMTRFISSTWKQQAILSTLSTGGDACAKISRDWLPLESGGVSSGRGSGRARLYYNVYTSRDQWFRSAHKSKAVLHMDGSGGVADAIPLGEAGTCPLIVMRAQVNNEHDDVHLTTTFSSPPEELEESVDMAGVYERLVWHIQAARLYDYTPAGLAPNLTVGGRKRERAPSSPTKNKFESVSRGFFKHGAGVANGRLGVPDADLTNSTNSHSHRRTRSLASKSSGNLTMGSVNSEVTSTPATSVDHRGSAPSHSTLAHTHTRTPSPLPKSPPAPAVFERKVKRKQTPPAADAEREAEAEAVARELHKRRTTEAQIDHERRLAVAKAEEEVEMLDYRDGVRASYLERPRSLPPPSSNVGVVGVSVARSEKSGSDSGSESESGNENEHGYPLDPPLPPRSHSSLATAGNYSTRSDASTSLPCGSDTDARTSDATNGNGSTISNSTSVDLKFGENDSSQFPRYEDAEEEADNDTDEDIAAAIARQPSYIAGGADEAIVREGRAGLNTVSRRRSTSVPTHSHTYTTNHTPTPTSPDQPHPESVSSSLIPPEPAFSMSRQTTNSSAWSRSTGTSSGLRSGVMSPGARKPFGPRDLTRSTGSTSSRSTLKSTPKVGNAYKMDLPVVRPLSIPSKNVAVEQVEVKAESQPKPQPLKPSKSTKSVPEDGYGYTSALDEWVYNDTADTSEKENKDRKIMPPPKSEIVRVDVGLSERKRKWEEICHSAGTTDESLNFLIDSLSDDARTLKKTKSGQIDSNSFAEMERSLELQVQVARQLQQRQKADAERTHKLEKQLNECKSEISVLYESFNEELDAILLLLDNHMRTGRTGKNVQTLAEILNNNELAEDFRTFLEYQEHSIENLNFILWFLSYKSRWSGLSGIEQDKSPSCRLNKWRKKTSINTQEQPYRREVDHIISVYFNNLSQFELNLPEDIQSYTLDLLRTSTHPDCFTKAYEHVNYLIQTSSIPQFMACKYPQPTKTPSRLKSFFKRL
ncbi:hypothetical protein E3P91_03059 [Wallemia ichthyophaga]|nr:hypothetical protein E3P91_03059 [Wallemia ichthyophaga]TIB60830.1 hypothetical protein E3P78_02999 [Wallemia ichthyophaga]